MLLKNSKALWWVVTLDTLKSYVLLRWIGISSMHDFLIALVFVAMVASPAIVVTAQKASDDEDF